DQQPAQQGSARVHTAPVVCRCVRVSTGSTYSRMPRSRRDMTGDGCSGFGCCAGPRRRPGTRCRASPSTERQRRRPVRQRSITLGSMSSATPPADPQPSGPERSLPPGQNQPPSSAPPHHHDRAATAPVPGGHVPAGPDRDHHLDRALPTVTHEDPSDPHASVYDHGFLRAAAVTLPVALADPATNAERHLEVLRDLDAQQVGLAVFPELLLTGYSLEDLVLQEPLLDAAEQAVLSVLEASRELMPLIVLGAPLRSADRSRIFNCAVTLHRGEILAIHPKQNLPTYREFHERRWFAPGDDADGVEVRLGAERQQLSPHGLVTVEDLPGLSLYVEICEDMWVPLTPSAEAALAGATVVANLSGSPITIGRADDRKLMARSASARAQAAYVYAAAGEGESTTDLAWDGQTFIYECGDLL